jgi:hypothetical protein
LAGAGLPVILCVGLPETPPPVSAAPPAQRRIDLLAIEQNAWVLAGRDRRCVVVQSRTEIDWAMKQGQMIVWAPSKLVLDAVDGPSAARATRLALALWLAETLAADAAGGAGRRGQRRRREAACRSCWSRCRPCQARRAAYWRRKCATTSAQFCRPMPPAPRGR